MAFTTKRVPDLTEATGAADNDNMLLNPTGSNGIRRITFANMMKAIKSKLLTLAFETLTTTDKTLPGAIIELNAKIVIERRTSASFAVAGNSRFEVNIGTTKAGYVPKMIAVTDTPNTDWIYPTKWKIENSSNKNAVVTIYNSYSSQIVGTVSVDVLYVKE